MADCLGVGIQFSPRHVPFLVEQLSRNAAVWRSLGTALQFQKGDLDNIQACQPLISTSPHSFMQRLVEEWLEGKYQHTAPPTLANLLKALNSHTVGLGTLATQIRDSLPQHDQSVGAKVFKIASVSYPVDITFNRREDIQVNENTRVHLKVEVEVETSSNLQTVQWHNKGLVPIHERHSSTRESVLCIPKADIDMDGSQYSCDIEYHRHKTVEGRMKKYKLGTNTTTPVTLRVSSPQLDQFKESLASIYLAQPEIPQDTWPPVSNKTYVNLALIKQQAINYGGEYARLTIRGDLDDILHHKEEIEYKNIFDGLRSGSLLLIEGRPGSGKTTFVHKISRDWAASDVQGPRRLVLLVSLRVLNSWEKPVTLNDILKLLNMQASPKLLEERNGKGVCFIFDGLDEFSPLEEENSIVFKIVNKNYLPQSTVIVASRPAALVNLRQRANKVIEVIGFPKVQIFEYVENYPFSNISKADHLKLYLLSHPNVLSMCYLPIHAAMVAFLFEVMGKVPRTETEIYKHFTRFTLMRSLSKHKRQYELEDMDTDKLSGEERELFDTICMFALEKTILKKQVLDQSEMKLHLQGRGCKDISLGLVTVDRTAGLYGFKNIYTFLHLTYQEYLAAHHISTLSNEDQHKLIKQYGDADHMQIVWKFYCGLINFEGHKYKIKALVKGRKKIILSDIQCAYESQQKVFCNCLINKMDAQILLKDKYLTTTDFTALGYLFASNSMPISLSLTNCNSMNTEAVGALLKEIEGKALCLRILSYESPDIDLESLTKLLSEQHSLEYLKISVSDANYSKNTLDDYCFADIVSPSLANLKELSLTNVQIGPRTLSSVLQFCEELTSLTLNDSIKENHIKSLLTEASKCKRLETVSCSIHSRFESKYSIDITCTGTNLDDLRLPMIDEDASMLCVQGVIGNYLHTLRLEVHVISIDHLKSSSLYWPPRPKLFALHLNPYNYDDAVPTIAECVSDFSVLEKLVLRNTEIDATLPTKILSHCFMLQELDLSHGQTKSPEIIATILTNLKICSNLMKLVLNDMYINTSSACVLASCLQCWPKLRELHLRGCGIEEEGAKATADNIKYCPELTKVDFSENNVSYETLQMIKSNSSHNKVTESSSPSYNEVSMSIFQPHDPCCCTLF